MKINTALILCAGYGKRLNPLTLTKPKPLIEVNNITLLENTINLIKKLNIKKIKINTFYLKNQIENLSNFMEMIFLAIQKTIMGLLETRVLYIMKNISIF